MPGARKTTHATPVASAAARPLARVSARSEASATASPSSFGQAEDGHGSTPISPSTDTSAGTASGPWPSTVACFLGASGRRSLVIRTSPPAAGAASQAGTRVMAARFARSRPGSEG